MAKKNQAKAEKKIEQVEAKQEKAEEKEGKPLQMRYVGGTIKFFDHNGKRYQLTPNSVYLNLPDCEQVKRLIESGELKQV